MRVGPSPAAGRGTPRRRFHCDPLSHTCGHCFADADCPLGQLCYLDENICVIGCSWGPCVGQVLPKPDLCDNGLDDDCNGTVDDTLDVDGDGYTICTGDCCEYPAQCGKNPALVHPGAIEIPGNGADDDCNPITPDQNE